MTYWTPAPGVRALCANCGRGPFAHSNATGACLLTKKPLRLPPTEQIESR